MENTEIKKEEKQNNKKISTKKILIIVFSIYGALILIIVGFFFIDKTYPSLAYKYYVESYLENKYNQKFEVKYDGKRHKGIYETSGCDGSTFSYKTGTDKDVMEYVFLFNPKDNKDIKGYVAYSYNEKTKESEIYEVSGKASELTICGNPQGEYYERNVQYYNEKQEIKEDLEKYFDPRNIDYTSYNGMISIKTGKSLEDEILKNYVSFSNMYNSLAKLLDGKGISISLTYVEKDKTIHSITIRSKCELEYDYTVQKILEDKRNITKGE